MVFSNNSEIFISGSTDKTIRLWDYNKGYIIEQYLTSSPCNALDISPCDSYLISGHSDGSLKIWKLSIISDRTQKI